MACGLALKRPHEYEAYLSEDTYETEAKRARTSAHCSPFRPQMGTMAASLPSTSLYSHKKEDSASPFESVAGKHQLSSSQLDAYLRSEIRALRRRKLIPRRTLGSMAGDENDADTKRRAEYRTPKSPTQSGSDSESEFCSGSMSHSSKASKPLFDQVAEKPQFSLKQVR
ncbi:hypothetical protein WR25_17966 isoform B [Diploscapter pachys]|uniref:Uncharacterized protein n=1 Tax=Diploscapter pachys TaxID=2018661 RepID=A0A2A2LC59_9BILA|nr:hypothetical protein WR25_17966 isoform B [Diploscapter pachys]